MSRLPAGCRLLILADLTCLAAGVGTGCRDARDDAVVSLGSHPQALPARALAFEPAAGRGAGWVDWAARGGDWSFFAGADRTELQVGDATLRTKLIGADAGARVRRAERLPGRVNWLVGNRKQWRTGLRLYGRVGHRSVWPGIDVVYYGRSNRLEY